MYETIEKDLRRISDWLEAIGTANVDYRKVVINAALDLNWYKTIKDAADALESADKRIATYQSDVADLEQREKELNDVLNERARLITELQARIAELESEMKRKDKEFEKMASDATDFEADLHERIAELVTKCRQLEAQLPKEGAWMTNIRWDYQQPTQTVATTTHFMCRSTGKLCQNATEYGYCKQTVCTIDLARG